MSSEPQLTPWRRFATVAGVEGEELRRRRERLKLSQTELAKLTGVTKSTILRYENGKIKIPKMFEMALEKVERETR